MRVSVLVGFMLITGAIVAWRSYALGLGTGAVALRVVVALVIIQAVYFCALLVLAALSRRAAPKERDGLTRHPPRDSASTPARSGRQDG